MQNYTAEVISRFAKAGPCGTGACGERWHSYTSHGRVTPMGLLGKPLGFTTLIDIKVHDFRIIGAQPEKDA